MPTQSRPDSITAITKAASSRASSRPDDCAHDFRLQLANRLQSSLDLLDVLNNFFKVSQSIVPNSGIDYRYPQKHISLSLGCQRAHNASYSLQAAGRLLGEIVFSRSQRFTEEELNNLETLLSFLVLPLRNALLYRDALEHSLKDPLTGIGNRTALDAAVKREFDLASRGRLPLSLLMADIDHFKNVNDTAGHSTGDNMIKKVAETIQGAIRQTDQAFRFGGEEYTVVLAGTDHNAAMRVAERVRSAAAAITVSSKIGPIGATISIGVSTLRSDDTPQTLFERADAALFDAKASGRDAVVSAEALHPEANAAGGKT